MKQQFQLERRIEASVDDTWAAFTGIIPPPLIEVGGEFAFPVGDWMLTERTLELDPPRRRVYAMVAGTPTHSYGGTIEFFPDGDACLLRWTVMAEPAVDPETFDTFFAQAKLVVADAIDMIIEKAKT